MSDHRKPKKPIRNPAHFVFSKAGPVRRVVEELPREQEALEFTVGRKFLGALQRFEGVQLHDLCRGSEPADLVCKSLDGHTIGLQIVEVINQQLRQLRHMRSSYREALVQILGKELLLFNGCRVSLVDSGEPPYLPPLTSTGGQACLRVVKEHVRKVAKDIHTLEVGKIRSRSTKTLNPEHKVSVLVERILPAGEPVRLELSWAGGGPSYRVDISRGLLTQAVQSKIAKRYAKPAVGKFVLLAYSIDTLLKGDDPDVSESRCILSSSQHPFDDAWFIYPYADKELGALVHIWPVHDTYG
jgi:hypothetical protein